MFYRTYFHHILSPFSIFPDLTYLSSNPTLCSLVLSVSNETTTKRKSNQIKQKNNLTKIIKTKCKEQRYLESLLQWNNYFWSWGLLWSVVDMSNNTALEKSDFQALSTGPSPLPPCWDFCVSNLYMFWTYCHSLCKFICKWTLLCLEYGFLGVTTPSGFYVLFVSSSI